MPKVHKRKARKDYPDDGVKKGDTYYTWSLKTGPRSSRTYRQLTPAKPWQLTTSAFLQQMHRINHDIGINEDHEVLQTILDSAEELKDETTDSLENLPESLQYSPTGELLQERVDGLDNFISELEDVISNANEAVEEIEDKETRLDDLETELANFDDDDDDDDHTDELSDQIETLKEEIAESKADLREVITEAQGLSIEC